MSEAKEKAAQRTVVKRVANAVQYSDGTVRVDNVRFSYPHVFKAHAVNEGDTPAFGITGLLPKATHVEARKLLSEMIQQVQKAAKIETVAADKKFLRDGDRKDEDGQFIRPKEERGHWTVNAREQRRPAVRGPNKEVLTSEDADKIYGGCWGNILIRPWAQNNKFGKRINAGLTAVQLGRTPSGADDSAFGEGRISDEEIDDTFESAEAETNARAQDDDEL